MRSFRSVSAPSAIPALTLVAAGCTRALDQAIFDERVRYAAERDDYHELMYGMSVQSIQRVLASPETRARRRETLADLLDAHRTRPHRLWELLLLQAFEAELVLRRRAVSEAPNADLDALVLRTFLESLVYPPRSVDASDLAAFVVSTSRDAFEQAVRRAGPATARRASLAA